MQEPQADIDKLLEFGAEYGYGRAIQLLQAAWTKELTSKWSLSETAALKASGIVCVWCNTDTRTGEEAQGKF